MSDSEASRQADNVTPAEPNSTLAIALDATAQKYDLNTLALGVGTTAPSAKGTQNADGAAQSYIYVKLIADVDFYYFFGPDNSLTIDNTAKLAVAGTVNGFTANAPDLVSAKSEHHVRINRTRHRWLYLQGSGAGTLRLRAASEPSARAVT